MLKKIENNLQARLWRWDVRKEIPAFQRELAAIVSSVPAGNVIIFPPGLAWQDSLIQRPQHLAGALADLGNQVFYIEPETSREQAGFQQLSEHFFLCHVPMQTFNALENPFIMTMTWNAPYALQVPQARIIYDYVDHLKVFSGNQKKLGDQHDLLLQSAAIILATSAQLYEQVQPVRSDVILCPNGVDFDHFVPSNHASQQPPADILPLLHTGAKIIAYVGALARWVDYDLIADVAKLRPEINFVLIGPDYESSLPNELMEIANLSWLGAKSYDDIPVYLQYIDMAMIPFQVNEMTHAVSPLKLFEYMAAGKPVIVTPMEGSMHYPGVLVAGDPQEFSRKITRALDLQSDQDYIKTIRQVANENTWENRAYQIMQAMEDFVS